MPNDNENGMEKSADGAVPNGTPETVKQNDDAKSESYDTKMILEKMRNEYWRGVTEVVSDESEDKTAVLTFVLGAEMFGMPAIYAKEILKIPSVVRVPRTPPSVLGIINLRGKITPIVDVRAVLGLKKMDIGLEGRVIITEFGDMHAGVLVEDVLGIENIPNEEITTVSAAIARKDYLDGQAMLEDKTLVVLNVEKLFNAPDFRSSISKK